MNTTQVQIPAPLSNVQIVCPHDGQPMQVIRQGRSRMLDADMAELSCGSHTTDWTTAKWMRNEMVNASMGEAKTVIFPMRRMRPSR